MSKSIIWGGLLAVLFARTAVAATCTWTGSGADSNWSTSGNWNNCGGAHAIPVDGDTLAFPDGTPRLTNSNDLVKLIAAQLLIGGGIDVSGNSIGLSDGIVANVPVTATVPVVHMNIVLETSPQTFQCSGFKTLSLDGAVNLNGHSLTLDSSNCNIMLNGNITGAGGLTKTGTLSAFLEGAGNTYTGVTTISAGRVRLVSNTALGASGVGNDTVVNDGAALELEDIATGEDLTLSGSGGTGQGVLVGAAGNNTLTGAITLAANATIAAAVGALLTIDGAVGGGVSMGLIKIGTGTVRLQNINTYGGTTIASEGPLEVNGVVASSGANPGGTLAGTGMATSVSITSGGAFSPGTAAGTKTGTFDTQTGFFWSGGGTMVFQLGADSTHSDHLAVAGIFAKASGSVFEFQFSDGATPPKAGVAYTLASFTSTGFSAGDFSFSYVGTGPGSGMLGSFGLTSTELTFTPSAVVSDLVFRDGME